jgi:hypothetical protein
MTYNNNHIEEYLNCKAKVEELLASIDSTSVYGKLMGKENEVLVEILESYIKLMKKMSWHQEYSRMR